MKKFHVVAIAAMSLFSASWAQSKTPASVLNAFKQKFPNAISVRWGKENATEWEASFTLEGTRLSANFLADGTWVETEKRIPVSELPKAVSGAIEKQYPNWNITEADQTETAKNGTIYEADIKSGSHKKEIAFKGDGTPVRE